MVINYCGSIFFLSTDEERKIFFFCFTHYVCSIWQYCKTGIILCSLTIRLRLRRVEIKYFRSVRCIRSNKLLLFWYYTSPARRQLYAAAAAARHALFV